MEQKTCLKCGERKPLENFAKNSSKKDGLQVHCRACKKLADAKYYNSNKHKQRVRVDEFRKTVRKKVLEYKESLGCKFCIENDPVALDFHHDSDKEFNIADAHRIGLCWRNLLKEMKKCEVVCSNCHRKIHADRKLTPRR